MVGLFLKLLTFLMANCQLLTSLILLTGLFLLLAKSIKRYAGIYYFVFAIPAILFVVREVCSLIDVHIPYFSRTSVLGEVIREYVHVAGFAYPLLVIVMFVGALSAQNRFVRRMLMIRKELSIISGFPILIHSWVRIRHNLLGAFDFFADTDAYMAKNEWVSSSLGAGLFNAGYILGIIMFVLFIILWVTSFDSVHRKLGSVRWKKIQRWSYVLYALLFIHSVLLNLGWMFNSNSGITPASIIAVASTCLIF
ncbi:MAG: ferric reductase-like transmembrane domain-containing protein, partial [Tannerella sp.]|nr:ferric reductase-like transmembrane domain-containing protein [Tannerella sp.]